MEYIIFTILFIMAIPLLIFLILKPSMEDKKIRNNVTNSDPFTQHYCFILNCNQQEVYPFDEINHLLGSYILQLLAFALVDT